MNKKSILIVGVHRSGTTSLGAKLSKQVGKFISEPWNSWVHTDSYKISTYPIDSYIGKFNTVVKTFPNQVPINYNSTKLDWLLELVEYMGVDRSTFIINDKGKIVKEWRAVKVKGHVQEVLETVQELLK